MTCSALKYRWLKLEPLKFHVRLLNCLTDHHLCFTCSQNRTAKIILALANFSYCVKQNNERYTKGNIFFNQKRVNRAQANSVLTLGNFFHNYSNDE